MKTLETKKTKTCKCNACGRWIANPVNVGGKVYGSGCAKKARIELVIQKERELLRNEVQEIELPSNSSISEVREACNKGKVTLIRPDGTTRKVSCIEEIELFPEVNMFYSAKRKVG